MGYAKLFSSITESSLWSEAKHVRLLFVTMLARADSTGFVEASVPGLARVSNLEMAETEAALEALQGPDPHSKDLEQFPEHEGRRITKVPGGWVLLNYENYRDRPDDVARREYMRGYMADYRKRRKHGVNNGKPRLTHTETETEATTDRKTLGRSPALNDEEWLQSLSRDEAYRGLAVATEHAKMVQWCAVNSKQPTRRRFINWLNRADRTIAVQPVTPSPSNGNQLSGVQRKQDNDELARIMSRMSTIRSQYEAHQAWGDSDRQEWEKLKARKQELKTKLGVVV